MNEVVKIYTADDLRTFRDRVNNCWSTLDAVLMNDVDIWETDEKGECVSWVPIGKNQTYPFRGTFDGKGHTVSGLCIYEEDRMWRNKYRTEEESERKELEALTGLFGRNVGTIKNLTVEGYIQRCDSYYTNIKCTGGICAVNDIANYTNGTQDIGIIENCINKCEIRSCYDVGGIVGENTGIIRGCVNAEKITGKNDSNHTSGIFGSGSGKQVTGCVNTGEICLEVLPDFETLKANNFKCNLPNQIGPGNDIDSSNRQEGKAGFPCQTSLAGMYLFRINNRDSEIEHVKEILANDSNPEYINSQGETYLHLFCRRCSSSRYSSLRYSSLSLDEQLITDVIKVLATETNIDFGAKDKYGKTAADYVKDEGIKKLIEAIYQEKKSKEIEDNDDSFSDIGF